MNEWRSIFEGEMSRAWSIFTCPFDHPTIMFRKAFFDDNNLRYDETYSHAEDWDLWLRAFDKGMKVGCIEEELTYHRWHSGGAGQTEKNTEMMCDLVRRNFGKLGVTVSEDLLSILSPWQGKLSEANLSRIELVFQETLQKNASSKLYDQQCLYKAFSIRLSEAKTGVMPRELWRPLDSIQLEHTFIHYEGKAENLLRQMIKRIIRPLYRPIRNRFEMRIRNTENIVTSLHENNYQLTKSIEALSEQLQSLERVVSNVYINQINDRSDAIVQTEKLIRQVSEMTNWIGQIDRNSNNVFKQLFEHTSALNDRLRDDIQGGNQEKKFWDCQNFANAVLEKKVFLIGVS
jgi:hypothetical protein